MAPITTDLERVRLLIPDTIEDAQLLTDDQIDAFLDIEGGSIKKATAAALETIAASEALVSKKITTQDLSTDGPAVAKELRERAKTLRDQADEEDVDGNSFFGIVERTSGRSKPELSEGAL